jgi:hypothetical protein
MKMTVAIKNGSTFRQARLAQPINAMLDVLRVLVDHNTFVSFNCETGVDPKHLRGFSLAPSTESA